MSLLPTLRSKNQNLADPFAAFRRELDSIFAAYNRALPTLAEVGARIPSLNIAETKDAIEITTELPGVDEKDINVSLDDNRLVISGEKKQESDRTDKEWDVVERSYGAFHRAIALPFEPNEASIEAHFDKRCSARICAEIRSPAGGSRPVRRSRAFGASGHYRTLIIASARDVGRIAELKDPARRTSGIGGDDGNA